MVCIDDDGELDMRRGLVSPSDAATHAAAGDDADGAADDADDDDVADAGHGLPYSLVESLTTHRTAALGAALSQNARVALAAVVHALALKAFYCFEKISAQLSPRKQTSLRGAEGSTARALLEKAAEDWRSQLPGNADGLFAWCLDHAGASRHQNEQDFLPVVKLFMPECGFVWLLTELDPEQPDIAFGLWQSILKICGKSACKRIALFLDSCESGIADLPEVRGIYAEMSEGELKDFFDAAEYRVCFASCKTSEYSYPSDVLQHGVWTHLIIEALQGNDPLALEKGRYLTANSLQNYVAKELPRTMRKLFTKPIVNRLSRRLGSTGAVRAIFRSRTWQTCSRNGMPSSRDSSR